MSAGLVFDAVGSHLTAVGRSLASGPELDRAAIGLIIPPKTVIFHVREDAWVGRASGQRALLVHRAASSGGAASSSSGRDCL
ncbi:hypothetical protein DMH04_09950 [Kibdelosporangium aridum]|uniref:Uncharacterized protein n=1 Tax=Kibdelosporangium aridum TaxID=2030 RepID=A0A428ZIV1_KIBAR|nr:hypothetical protein DMH04_09950 [Kibdelosporangium aridum]